MERDAKLEILSEVKHINRLLNDLQKNGDCTIIDSASAALRDNVMQRKRTLIKEYVDDIHKAKISPPTSKVRFYPTRANVHKFRATTLDDLYTKLFIAYGGELYISNTFGKIFEYALAERGQIRAKETIDALRINYSRFFTQDFSSKPIHNKFLTRLCKKLGYSIKNNHAIRMYFNSYVLIPKGVVVTNRAKLPGHSVEVNLKYYSFEDYNYCDSVGALFNKSA